MPVPHIDWIVWSIVLAGIADLSDIKENWSMFDIIDCHIAMRYKNSIEEEQVYKTKLEREKQSRANNLRMYGRK